MNRKDFIKKTGTLITISVFAGISSCSEENIAPELSKKITLDLNKDPFTELLNDGGWVLHPDENIIIVNWNGEIRSFTSICTHSQCSRNWVFGGPEATCTCHGSKFNWEGKVIQGPAKNDLKSFQISRDNNLIIIN